MRSAAYTLFVQAMRERKPVVCVYGGHRRELCPIILGHTAGEEKALTYQFAGGSGSRLPAEGDWRCLFLSGVAEAVLRDGPWRAGESHQLRQRCVEDVDLDVNPASPYSPKRRL